MCRGCFNQLFLRDSSIPARSPACSVRRRACPPDARSAYSVAAASALNAVGAAPVFAADEGALRGQTVVIVPRAIEPIFPLAKRPITV